MSKRDYQAAALIAQTAPKASRADVVEAFVDFFRLDRGSNRFDEGCFREACAPGANVHARPIRREVTA